MLTPSTAKFLLTDKGINRSLIYQDFEALKIAVHFTVKATWQLLNTKLF